MDYIPSSLNLMIKEQRKSKKPFPPIVRKLLIFQLFKALYYMQVFPCTLSSPKFVIGISSHPTYSLTTARMSSKYAISVQLRSWRRKKATLPISARDTIGRPNLSCRPLTMERKSTCGRSDVSLWSCLLSSPFFQETAPWSN